AMRTMQLKEAHCTAAVAKGDEILTHDAKAARQISQFIGQYDRLPVPPQVLAAGRAWPDSRKLLVIRRALAMMVRAIDCAQKRCSLWHGIPPQAPDCPRSYQRILHSSNAQSAPSGCSA